MGGQGHLNFFQTETGRPASLAILAVRGFVEKLVSAMRYYAIFVNTIILSQNMLARQEEIYLLGGTIMFGK